MRFIVFVVIYMASVAANAQGSWTYSGTQRNNYDDALAVCAQYSGTREYYVEHVTGSNLYSCYYCSSTIGCGECPDGHLWDNEQQQCINDTPECPPGAAWNGEVCSCPSGQKMGYAGTVEGGLTEQCIDEVPPPQECPPEAPQVGTINGQPVCDWQENSCPAGYNPGYVNGELYCSPIIDDDPQCHNGGYYGTVGGTTGCFDPDPNIDDPDYPPNQDPDSPSWPGPDPLNPTFPNYPQWPSPNNPNYNPPAPGEFDDSNIVNELSQIKGRVGQTNTKLDTANNHLSDIAESLDGTGANFGGGPSSGVQSFYESEYPGGIAGVWDSNKAALMSTPVFGFVDQFQFDYNDSSVPSWQMCFDMGALGNLGCKDLSVPPYVWAFIKIVMLVSTAFLCRRLIFGG